MTHKHFLATSLLACVSLALVVGASGHFIRNQTVGAYHQQTLAGDPTFAQGLTVQADVTSRQDLYWTFNTHLDGADDATRDAYALTENQFGLGDDYRNVGVHDPKGLFLWSDLYELILPDAWIPADEPSPRYTIFDYARDQVEVGETKVITLQMDTFFDDIPFAQMIGRDCELPYEADTIFTSGNQTVYGTDDIFAQVFAQTFPYPMPDDAVYSCKITRDSESSTSGETMSDTVYYAPLLDSVTTDNGFYFTLYVERMVDNAPTTLLDPSGVDIGFGLYHVTWEGNAPRFTCVVPLDWTTVQGLRVAVSTDKAQVYLLARTAQGELMTVVDAQTSDILQQMLMPQYPAISDMIVLDNALLCPLVSQSETDTPSFALFARQADGTLVHAFDGKDARIDVDTLQQVWDDESAYSWQEVTQPVYLLDNATGLQLYDGERLALVHTVDNRWSGTAFVLAVYDENGQQYVGKYTCDFGGPEEFFLQYEDSLQVRLSH